MITCFVRLKALKTALFLQLFPNLTVGKYGDLFGANLTITQLLVRGRLEVHCFRSLALARARRDILYCYMVVHVVIGACMVGNVVHLLQQVSVQVLTALEIELSRLLLGEVGVERIVGFRCHGRGGLGHLLAIILVARVDGDVLLAVLGRLHATVVRAREGVMLVALESFLTHDCQLLLLVGKVLLVLCVGHVLVNLALALVLDAVVPPRTRLLRGRTRGLGRRARDADARLRARRAAARRSELCAPLLEVLRVDHHGLVVLRLPLLLFVLAPVALGSGSLARLMHG